jgi:positive phototaxis protein PixI
MNKTIDRMSSPATNQQHSPDREDESDLQRFLGFTIGDNLKALIPLMNLQATIKISVAEILPVPQMNESLLGVINYGGKATWVADIAHLMGGSYYIAAQNSTTAMGLLFEVENETVALLIDRVGTIETFDLRQCLPISDAMFADPVRSFLSGYFIDDRQQLRTIIDLHQVIKSIG